jgi:hypothetical protein
MDERNGQSDGSRSGLQTPHAETRAEIADNAYFIL